MSNRAIVWTLAILATLLVFLPLLSMLGMMSMGGMMRRGGMMGLGGNMMAMSPVGLIWMLVATAVVIALVVMLIRGVKT